jgi:hypothetical protein
MEGPRPRPRNLAKADGLLLDYCAMPKLTILTVATAALLVAAAVANVVFFPIPPGPIRACPFGAIWGVIWPKTSPI